MEIQSTLKLCRDIAGEICRLCPQYWKGQCGALVQPVIKGREGNKSLHKTVPRYGTFSSTVSEYQLSLWS